MKPVCCLSYLMLTYLSPDCKFFSYCRASCMREYVNVSLKFLTGPMKTWPRFHPKEVLLWFFGTDNKLLIESDEQISRIAFLSGFNNMANFNRIFKSAHQCSPMQFRKIYQEKSKFDWNKQITPGQFIPPGNAGARTEKTDQGLPHRRSGMAQTSHTRQRMSDVYFDQVNVRERRMSIPVVSIKIIPILTDSNSTTTRRCSSRVSFSLWSAFITTVGYRITSGSPLRTA